LLGLPHCSIYYASYVYYLESLIFVNGYTDKKTNHMFDKGPYQRMLYDQSPSNIKHRPLLNLRNKKRMVERNKWLSHQMMRKQPPIAMKENNTTVTSFSMVSSGISWK
jgi:hypothetical protein